MVIIASIEVQNRDGSRHPISGDHAFVSLPSPGDRVLLPTMSPDSWDPFMVLFVEHHPKWQGGTMEPFPPKVTVVIEML